MTKEQKVKMIEDAKIIAKAMADHITAELEEIYEEMKKWKGANE